LSPGHRIYISLYRPSDISLERASKRSTFSGSLSPFLPFLRKARNVCERLRNAGNKFIPARNNICAGRGNIPVPPTSTQEYSLCTQVCMCAVHTVHERRATAGRAITITPLGYRVCIRPRKRPRSTRVHCGVHLVATRNDARSMCVCVCVCVCVCYARVYVPIAGVVWGMAIFLKNYRYSHLFKCARGRIDEYR